MSSKKQFVGIYIIDYLAGMIVNQPIQSFDHPIDVKIELKIIFAISLGLFLVIFFLQPFELPQFNANNQILFHAGFGVIVFILIAFFHALLPKSSPKLFRKSIWEIDSADMVSFLNWILCTVAFAFYIRYVGKIHLTFYTVFKSLILSFAPIGILKTVYKIRRLKYQNYLLQQKIKGNNNDIEDNNEYQKVQIELLSENKSEMIKIPLPELIMVRSADNYIEILQKEDKKIKKSLLRKTLKSVDDELEFYDAIIRCHRTCIINKYYIERIMRKHGAYKIKLKGHDMLIPLSRQYLMDVKKSFGMLNNNQNL